MVSHVTGDPRKLEGTLNHPERGVAIAIHDPVAQRTMIGTNAHGDSALLTQLDQRRKLLADAFDFCRILGIGIFTNFKFFGVSIVAGIDTHLIYPFGSLEGRFRLEMDIGNNRHITTGCSHPGHDMLEVSRIFDCRRSDPHYLAADFRQTQRFGNALLRVHRVTSQHRLHPDRIIATDPNLTNHHSTRSTARVSIRASAVAQWLPGSQTHGSAVGAASTSAASGSTNFRLFWPPTWSPTS